MYNCFDIAKKFLLLAKEEGYALDPMKLLKLTYLAQGWYLGFNGKPLFVNQIQAWKYGPVIPELYHVIKRFGFSPVDVEIIDIYSEKPVSSVDGQFVKHIWEHYKKSTGIELSAKTHEVGSPWHMVYRDGLMNGAITNDILQTYYSRLVEEGRQKLRS